MLGLATVARVLLTWPEACCVNDVLMFANWSMVIAQISAERMHVIPTVRLFEVVDLVFSGDECERQACVLVDCTEYVLIIFYRCRWYLFPSGMASRLLF